MITSRVELWKQLEENIPLPTRFRRLYKISYHEFLTKIYSNLDLDMIENLYAGDAYIIKGGFPRQWIIKLRRDVHDYCMTHKSLFFKMLEGTPDFHRIIDFENASKYSIGSCKHSCYFYHWNEDPFNVFEIINQRWRPLKLLMGLQYNEYENNTPKDGVVDRIQVVRYPPNLGYLEPHVDAYQHQRLIFSGYMSQRGVDYQGGGFYLINSENEPVNIEDEIETGDFLFCYASVFHGVAPCDIDKECDWTKDDGRWFLSMYSNASDELEDKNGVVFPPRATASPIKLDIPGVLPSVPTTTE